MKTEEALLNILREQVRSYGQFLDLLKRERKSLINIKPREIEEIAKEKDTMLMRLKLLEEERQRLVNKFRDEHDIEREINLQDISNITGNHTFHSLRSELLSLLRTIEEMNRFNNVLIERSINFLRSTTNFFDSFKGRGSFNSTGILISKES